MKPRTLSITTLGRLLAVMLGLTFLAACSSSSSSSTATGTPAVSLTVNNLTFSSAVGVASSPQMVSLTNTGTGTLTFTSITTSNAVFSQTNTCGTTLGAGSGCNISVIFTPTALDPPASPATGTLTIADNVSGSPQNVSLSGTSTSVSLTPASLTFSGVAVGTSSAPQPVTLNNAGASALAISSTTISGDFSISTNTCVASVIAGGTCTISVIFSPLGSGPWTGTLSVMDAVGTQTVALTGTSTVANSVPVTVSFGPNGFTTTGNSYYNGIFTSVTVCEPGSTTNCAVVPDVLVDTGSYGLRVLSSALGGITLPHANDPSSGDPIYECVQYGDLSYSWGPVQMAAVSMGGETASQVPAAEGGTANSGIPIQVISAGVTPPAAVGLVGSAQTYSNPCLINFVTGNPSGGQNDDSVANLGSNGILGIGTLPLDCGTDCTTIANTSGQYLICNGVGSSTCDIDAVSLAQQVWNPVAAFSSGDSNGEVLQLPSLTTSAGEPTVPGTLIFGIGTQANNGLSGATVYGLDDYSNFQSATLYRVTYTSTNTYLGTFIDSGSNALYVLDPATLTSLKSQTGVSSVTDCADNGYYCTSSTLNLPLTLAGSNGTTSPTEMLSVESADSLLNSTDAALDDLGGDSCVAPSGTACSAASDYIDLGLPFFFGRPIFVGIAGVSSTYPNGFWAF